MQLTPYLNLKSIPRCGDLVLANYFNEDAFAITKDHNLRNNSVGNYEDRQAYIREALECSSWEQIVLIIKREFTEAKHVLAITVGQEEDRSSGYPIRWIRFAYAY